jgi:hypothetical protein
MRGSIEERQKDLLRQQKATSLHARSSSRFGSQLWLTFALKKIEFITLKGIDDEERSTKTINVQR